MYSYCRFKWRFWIRFQGNNRKIPLWVACKGKKQGNISQNISFELFTTKRTKFIPYQPVINVNGRKIVVTMVITTIILFWRASCIDWYNSRIWNTFSRNSVVLITANKYETSWLTDSYYEYYWIYYIIYLGLIITKILFLNILIFIEFKYK